MPSSFRVHHSNRPVDYRTPSPPVNAFEPVSPLSWHNDDIEAPFNHVERPSLPNYPPQFRHETDEIYYDRGHRSKDSMEFFAEIALATQSPIPLDMNTAVKRSSDESVDYERPLKRAKSEKPLSPEISIKRSVNESRPVTSYARITQNRVSDAELLLDFSQAARQSSRREPLNSIVDMSVEGRTEQKNHIKKPLSPQIRLQQPEHLGNDSERTELSPSGDDQDAHPNSKHSSILAEPIASVHGTLEAQNPDQVQLSGVLGEQMTQERSAGSTEDGTQIPIPVEDPAVEQKQRSGPSAVCASCKFARNSLYMDGDQNATSWISCDACKDWFHFACAGFKNEREVRSVDKFRCKKCKPIHGATTYVRKSSRAHTAIDYAGLHQGVIKTSDDRMEHHYIQPIKEGIITFLPESFPRMRPELVTAEFFEKGGGMKEPVVIPAEFNPRPKPLFTNPQGDLQAAKTTLSDEEEIVTGEAEDHYVPDEGQDALDMVIPQGLTVRHVAELYGPEEKVEVIDVKSQNGEGKKWNMRRWADYYENPSNKVVRNVISLEVSQSMLGRLIRRPKIVRDLDLQDAVWPDDLLAKGEFPRVQFYCLMSVADCFTDFHIDFGGSSVFYHILKGKKTFLFIPPKEKHLKKYEEWCMSPAQNWTFLADQTKECYRVDLSEGDTALIPSGWIHAVWTPEDSLVIGGNFLTRMNFGMQLRVAQVEKATGVARKFRYPHFQKIHWYTAFQYLDEDPVPDTVKELLYNGESFKRDVPSHFEFDAWGENSRLGKENYHAKYYSQSELDGLPELTRYLLRTALIDSGSITDGITAETRNAVRKSIPRGHGEPLDVVKAFAAWCAWKRGDEPIPHWAYPDAQPEVLATDKLSAAASRKLDREAALEAALQAPRRQSKRRQSNQQKQPENVGDIPSVQPSEQAIKELHSEDLVTAEPSVVQTSPLGLDGTLPQDALLSNSFPSNRKTACDACRKRRRACKHKDEVAAQNSINGIITVSPKPVRAEAPTSPLQTKAQDFDLSQEAQPVVDDESSEKKDVPPETSSLSTDVLAAQSLENLIHDENEPGSTVDSTAGQETTTNGTTPARPRTKACNECRKSKVSCLLSNQIRSQYLIFIILQRRCVHDAFGNEDPVKVAESAIPRPHARKNRKASDTHANAKGLETGLDKGLEDSPLRAPTANMVPTVQPESSSLTNAAADVGLPVSDSAETPKLDTTTPTNGTITSDSVLMELESLLHQDGGSINVSASQKANIPSTEQPEEGNPAIESGAEGGKMEPSGQTTHLMSPPASSHDDIGNSPTNGDHTHSPSPPASRLPSQQSPKVQVVRISQQRTTPESTTARRASSVIFEVPNKHPTDAAKDEMTATTIVTTTTTTTLPHKNQKSRRPSEANLEADEESLKLIKELQAQDLGLRKRASIRS